MLHYQIEFDDYRQHLIHVTLRFLANPNQELWLPTWIPGSYLIREFSKHIESVKASDEAGRLLKIKKTEKNSNYVINLAMAYGGREEIVDAVSKIVKDVKLGKISEITEEIVQKNLYLQSEPDLIIRTGGVKRTSNFLMWQSHYSEWFFVDKTWPEFEEQDLKAILEEFYQRERRFGK